MKRLAILAILAGVVLVPAASAQQKSILSAIPEDVLGYVVLNRLEEANGKLEKLAKQLKAPLPFSPLAFAKQVLGFDKGVNSKGNLAIALYPGLDGDVEPVPVIFVPITNYKDFLESFNGKEIAKGVSEIKVFGEAHAVGHKGDFALLARRDHTEFLKRALASKKSVAASSDALEMWLGDQDVAGVMTTRGLKLTGALARKGLQDAKANFGDLPPEAKFLEGMVEGVINFTKSAESDVTHLALGGRLDAAGNFHVDARALFAKGSNFAKASKGMKALPGGPLAGLPAGPFAFALGGSMGEDTMKALSRWSVDIVKSTQELPADAVKKLENYYAQLTKGTQGTSVLIGVPKEGAPLFGAMTFITHVKDAQAYLASYEQGVKDLNALVKDVKIPGVPAMELRKTKVSGLSVLELTMDASAGLGNEELEKVIMEKMFGKGGKLKASVVALDATTIMTRYTPADGLKDAIAAFKKKGLAADPAVAKTASLLPADAQWVFYLSPSGAIELINQAMTAFDGPVQIPAYPATPPVALAIKLSEGGLEVRAVAPAAFVNNLADFIEKLKALN